MPSEAAKKRKEKKKAQNQNRGKQAPKAQAETNGTTNGPINGSDKNGSLQDSMVSLKLSNLSVSGVLLSHPESRDVHLGTISLRYHGAELLTDATCELNSGRRYGLLGANGCGKMNVMFFILVCSVMKFKFYEITTLLGGNVLIPSFYQYISFFSNEDDIHKFYIVR